ncbi:MAG: holo-ACP synthase [Dethiobacteria bacterium]|nr:holo-ACP synthase [Bacillota bacterium]
MIKGIGIDLVELARIERVYRRFPQKFLARIFTSKEREELFRRQNLIPALAARFAAKEAVVKALGSGIGAVSWQDIELLREENTAPSVNLYGTAKEFAIRFGIDGLKVSWSHGRNYAVAQAVAYGVF